LNINLLISKNRQKLLKKGFHADISIFSKFVCKNEF
jgi:hypothetical protein